MKKSMRTGRTGGRRSRGMLSAAAHFEALEARQLLSGGDEHEHTFAGFLPPTHRLWNAGGYLSQPAPGQPLGVALSYLRQQASALNLRAEDLADVRVTDQYADIDTGVTHIYLRQLRDGLEITNANLNVNVARDGRIISVKRLP